MKQFTLKSITNLQFAIKTGFSKTGLQEGLDYLNSQIQSTQYLNNYLKKSSLTLNLNGLDGGIYKFEFEVILNDKQIKALTSIQTLINHITEELQNIFARDESEDIWDPYIRVTSYIDQGKNHIVFQVLKDIPE
jgi:hypothetical protein